MDMPDTPMPIMPFTTARGPLMLSQRLRLILPSSTALMATLTDWVTMVWDTEHTDMDTLTPIMATTMARGPLMPSPPLLPSLRLMPSTATTVMPGPTTGTATDTDWATEATTMDKFSGSEVQSRSSKRTSLLVI